MVDSGKKFIFFVNVQLKLPENMETLELPEVNLSTGKTDRKKTSLTASSRSKSRQLRRNHATVDESGTANNHPASALTVSIRPSVCLHLYQCIDFSVLAERSYCYTVWSAIGRILSVCPSVCLWRCALWLLGSVYMAKSCRTYQRVPSRQIPMWIEFGCVHKIYPEESDCVPAVRSPKPITETGLIVRLYM